MIENRQAITPKALRRIAVTTVTTLALLAAMLPLATYASQLSNIEAANKAITEFAKWEQTHDRFKAGGRGLEKAAANITDENLKPVRPAILRDSLRDIYLSFGSFAEQAHGIIQDNKLGPDNPAVIAVTETVNLLDTIPSNPPLDGLARVLGGTQPIPQTDLVIGIIPTLTQTLKIYIDLLLAQPSPTPGEPALQKIYLVGHSAGLLVRLATIVGDLALLILIRQLLGSEVLRGQGEGLRGQIVAFGDIFDREQPGSAGQALISLIDAITRAIARLTSSETSGQRKRRLADLHSLVYLVESSARD